VRKYTLRTSGRCWNEYKKNCSQQRREQITDKKKRSLTRQWPSPAHINWHLRLLAVQIYNCSSIYYVCGLQLIVHTAAMKCHLLSVVDMWNIILTYHFGGAEIASTGKCKYGKVKYKVAKCVRVENTSTEKSSMSSVWHVTALNPYKHFNARWRRKQHGGVRPDWWRRHWTQMQQWSYCGSNCYTSSCFSSHHMWRLSRCSTRKHRFRAMWTCNVLQTMCRDTCGS